MNQTQLPTTADDIAARILKLIENTHAADDLAPDGIERSTGIKVEFNRDDPQLYGFGNRLDDTWCYNLMSLPGDDARQSPEKLIFSFDDQSGRSQPPPVGQLDFEAYAHAMKASGYAGSMRLGPRGAFDAFTFKRDGISVDVYVRGGDADPQRLRVSSLIIDASEVRHD